MNLVQNILKPNKSVTAHPDVAATKALWNGVLWRAVTLPVSDTAQIRLRDVTKRFSLQDFPSDIGWYASNPAGGTLYVRLRASDAGAVIAEAVLELNPEARPVPLPWPADPAEIGPAACFEFHAAAEDITTLQIHRVLDRNELLSLAQGVGFEIGPGLRPQVFVNDRVTKISYLEEMPAEMWQKLYDETGQRGSKKADWSNYIIGKALDLPCEDSSLDFIFSSHVVEHLANPFGHFLRWREKMRPGGVILGVVPDLMCTNDYTAHPSTIEELEAERAADIWAPTMAHFERFVTLRPGQSAQKLFDEKFSIHVHFYTAHSMAGLLDHMVRAHGFSRFRIFSSRNHKDFYFALWT